MKKPDEERSEVGDFPLPGDLPDRGDVFPIEESPDHRPPIAPEEIHPGRQLGERIPAADPPTYKPAPEDFATVEKWTKKDLRDRRRADTLMLEAAGASKKEITQLRRLQRKGKADKVAKWYEEQRLRIASKTGSEESC